MTDVQPCGERHAADGPCMRCDDLCGKAMDQAARQLLDHLARYPRQAI